MNNCIMHTLRSREKKRVQYSNKAKDFIALVSPFCYVCEIGGEVLLIFFFNNFLVVLANPLKTLLRTFCCFLRWLRNENKARAEMARKLWDVCVVVFVLTMSFCLGFCWFLPHLSSWEKWLYLKVLFFLILCNIFKFIFGCEVSTFKISTKCHQIVQLITQLILNCSI